MEPPPTISECNEGTQVGKRRLGSFNPLSNAREIMSVVRELSLDDLHAVAVRPPRVAVVSKTVDDARQRALDVFGESAPDLVIAQGEDDPWPNRADVVVLDASARPKRSTGSARVVEVSPGQSTKQIQQAVVAVGDDLEISLGRHFPTLRQAAAMRVVNSTSRVNGQFALMSNIPALVPVVGGVLAAGADTIVLTKNQLMMIYKLAAIHGRDLESRFAIYREMVPVVGAGLVWRTVARDLAALLPFAAGAVPKVMIAFAGTYSAGMAAHVYYTEGKAANAERVREFYSKAVQELRETPNLVRSLPGAGLLKRDDKPPTVIDADYRSDTSLPAS